MRVIVPIVVLLSVACQSAPSRTLPSGPLGAIAAAATATTVTDLPDTHFETFLGLLDLKTTFGARADVIADQLRATRAAVAKTKSSARGAGGRLASVPAAGPTSLFSIPLFAATLAGVLDTLTKKGGVAQKQSPPLDESQQDATTKTTTSLRTTETFNGAGSVVTYSMVWTYRMTVVDIATVQTIVDGIDERTMVGKIDVCPDANGNTNASLDVKAIVDATKLVGGNGQQTHSESTSASTFTGRVDDSATLRSVKQEFTEKASWQTASGTGSYDTSLSASHSAQSDGSFLGGLDVSSFAGTFNTSGDQTGIDVSKATAWTFNIDSWAMNEPFQSAQRLWRNGRCVMVLAPTYNAETPIEVGEQTKSQHDEQVDVSSETKIAVNLKHRFGGGALAQSVTAMLTSGGKTLDPSRLESVPSSLTYKAPDERDKKAEAKLQSTSKRGIGTLVLDFHIGEQALSLTLTAVVKMHEATPLTTVDALFNVTIGPLEFKKVGVDDLWSASGEWQARTHTEGLVNGGQSMCDGSEHGTITVQAHAASRGGRPVWIIDRTPRDAEGSGSSVCTIGATQGINGIGAQKFTTETDGESVEGVLVTADEIVIPAEGGPVAIQGARNIGQQAWTVRGTADAKTTK